MIGKGAYGKVFLVKRISTGDIYAMKVVNIAENVKTPLQNLDFKLTFSPFKTTRKTGSSIMLKT